MGQYALIEGLGLLVILQLTAALRIKNEEGFTCSEKECLCEGHAIGPGNTGDFAHDAKTEDGNYNSTTASFWDFNTFQYGKEVPMSAFKSKLALVVNVASAWGFANAFYKSAADLLKNYQAKGLTLIAVPVNQHGAQAPHSSHCERSMLYHKMGMSDFPVLDKVEANGPDAVGFYKFLKTKMPMAEGGVLSMLPKVAQGELSWNYEKFLVNEQGQVVGRHTHMVDAKDLEGQIKTILESQ